MKSIKTLSQTKPSLKSEKANQALVIGGCMRSGTSIMGTLLGSLRQVEYFFEPAFLHKVLFKLDRIPAEIGSELFESFLYDELLLNGLAGRNLNFNSHDGSHIYRRKSEAEIAPRLQRSFGRLELQELAKASIPAFKLPDIIFLTERLAEWYPDQKRLFLLREPNAVLNSLLRKGWNSDDQLSIHAPEPMRDVRIVGDKRIPLWVREADIQTWLNSSELDRCAYYYCRINQVLKANIQHARVVNYDALIHHPQQVLDWICETWHLDYGDKTPEILASIQPQDSPKQELLDKIDPVYQAQIEELHTFFSTYSGTNYLQAI